MTKSDSRNVIVVLGMHRSGTSAVSGALETLGFSIGKNIMPSTSNNPKGYFENKNIVDFNDHLLKQLGVNWADAYRLPYHFIKGQQFFTEQKDLLKKLILDEFDWNGPILIKDPRMCILLPFWQPVFKELKLNPSYIIVSRHPAGVAASLKMRDNLTEFRSEKLWLYYNLCAELYTRNERRHLISYDHLLSDRPSVASRLINYLPMPFVPGPDTEKRIFGFIEPGLNHHNIGNAPGKFKFTETVRLNNLLEHACKSVNFKGLEGKMDEIRTGPELAKIFMSPAHEEDQARITLESDEGKSFDQYFKINYDTEQIVLEYEQSVPINKLSFNPASCSCLITLNQIRILNQEDQLINTENLETNATYTDGSLFLFNFPFPIIRFTFNPITGPFRLIITLHYHMIGERTSSYFMETFFRKVIEEKHDLKLGLDKAQKDLLLANKKLEEKTGQLRAIQNYPGFLMLKIMKKPWHVVRSYFRSNSKKPA